MSITIYSIVKFILIVLWSILKFCLFSWSKVFKEKKSARENFVCGACGQVYLFICD